MTTALMRRRFFCCCEFLVTRVAHAHGPDVSRAVNTIFDIWMEPIATAITDTNQVGTTGLGYMQFFEPDSVATSLWPPEGRYTIAAL